MDGWEDGSLAGEGTAVGQALAPLTSFTMKATEIAFATSRAAFVKKYGADAKTRMSAATIGAALVAGLGPSAIPVLGDLLNRVIQWAGDDPRDLRTRAEVDNTARFLTAGFTGRGVEAGLEALGVPKVRAHIVGRSFDSVAERLGMPLPLQRGAPPVWSVAKSTAGGWADVAESLPAIIADGPRAQDFVAAAKALAPLVGGGTAGVIKASENWLVLAARRRPARR